MADLALRTAATTIEQALKNKLLLAYGQRVGPTGRNVAVATIALLRSSFARANLKGDELAYVTSKAYAYQFSQVSTASDEGDAVVKPTDGGTAGRWLKTTSTVASGYVRAVRVHLGDDSYKAMLIQSQAVRPSLHIFFRGASSRPKSHIKGALYEYAMRFSIRAISTSLRYGAEGAEGSDISAEAALDPGSHNMIGDVKVALAGSNLGVTGMQYCEIGDERLVGNADAGRLVVEEIEITAYATVHNPDIDLVTLDGVREFDVTRSLAGGEYDADNIVTSGYTIAPVAGLTATPAPGVAVVEGTAVSSSPAAKLFTASRDTYRDLTTAGTFTYQEVFNGAAAPAVTSGALRVGVTVTDATDITFDAMLCATLKTFGAEDQVPSS